MLLSLYLNGAYDKPFQEGIPGLAFHRLLDDPRYIRDTSDPLALLQDGHSPRVIFMSSISFLSRYNMSPWNASIRNANQHRDRNTIIVAGEDESGRIRELINRSRDHLTILGTVTPFDENQPVPSGSLGRVSQLEDLVRVFQVQEIIFQRRMFLSLFLPAA